METKHITITTSAKLTVKPGEHVEIVEEVDASAFIELRVGAGARVVYRALSPGGTIARSAEVMRNATFVLYDYAVQGAITARTDVALQEPGADARIHALVLQCDNQRSSIFHATHHNAPHTSSSITTKGVLLDRSTAVYNGLVRIAPRARHSSGHQLITTLVLGQQAHIEQNPFLEIHNDDMRCSHSASITHVDEDQLFYLTSRGLSPAAAKQTLIKGFLSHDTDASCPSLIGDVITKKIATVC